MLSVLFAGLLFIANGAEYANTPHGRRLRKCVHHASSGSVISTYDEYTEIYNSKTGSRRQYPRDQDCIDDLENVHTLNGNLKQWEDYAYFALSKDDNMGNFTSTYKLPSVSPPAKGQLLYFFIGLQNDATPPVSIVQPVVNYCGNSTDCDSFNFTQGWSMEPWNCCPNGQSWYGDNIGVTLGDSVSGWIYAGKVETSVEIGMMDATTNGPKSTLMVNDTSRVWDWAAATLEQYNADLCSYYNSDPFQCTDMVLTDMAGNMVTPTWTTTGDALCKGGVVVTDPADVSIYGANMP